MNKEIDLKYLSSGEFGDTATTQIRPYKQYAKERTRIAIPGGELTGEVMQFLQNIGLDLGNPGRKLKISVGNMPLDLIVIRASTVPEMVERDDSLIKAGITGSDILWEAGMGKDAGEKLPVGEINDEPEDTWQLYIGMSQKLSRQIAQVKDRRPTILDLNGQTIVSKFPRITTEILQERIGKFDVFYTPGKVEAIQYCLPYNGVMDVVASGATAKANGIQILDRFYDVTTRMITSSDNKLNATDRAVLNEFKNCIYVAQQSRRML